MMQQEFEKIAGYEVSANDYHDIIEPMYLATNLSKEEFVACINKKRFALKPLDYLIKEMRKCAESLKETCTHYTDYETQDRLDELIEEYIDRKGFGDTISYNVDEQMLWSCFYPVKVVLFWRKTGEVVEVIKLI